MRHNPKTGILSGYYRLIESYRNMHDRICHRTILSAEFLDDLSVEQLNKIQKGLNNRVECSDNTLFPDENDPLVISFIEHIYQQMVREKKMDVSPKPTKDIDLQTIDIDSLKNKDVRKASAEWLCYQAIRQLKIDKFPEIKGWEEDKISLAIPHLISRAVYSETE
jgi:hypothetical protein